MPLNDGDKALVRAFMAWLRERGLAICVRIDEPEGTYERVLWDPVAWEREEAWLARDFAADMDREEAQEQREEHKRG